MIDKQLLPSLSLEEDFKPLLKLAIPLVITALIQSSVTFFCNIFLAQLGENTLAAGALVTWLYFTLIVLLFGTFNSINVLVSHQYGAKNYLNISVILRDGVILALLLLIPTFLLIWNMSGLFVWFGQKPELATLASLYLHALAWGLFPKFILIVLFEFIIGLGHTRLTLTFTMLSIPLYLFFSYVLIFGAFGFPELGIAGAGWGMTIGDWLTTLALSAYLLWNKSYRHYLLAIFNFNRSNYVFELIHLGLPMGVMFCLEVGFFFALTLLMGRINVETLAANQLTMQYLGPLMGIVFSLAQAVTVRMGHQIGGKEFHAAENTAYTGVILAALFMLIVAIFYWFAPHLLISVDFNINNPKYQETITTATQFLFIAAFFQILESIRITLFGVLRGLKDTRFTLVTSVISFWFISLSVGYILASYFSMKGNGFWWGMVVGVSCSVTLLYLRFTKKIKQLELS